LSIKASKITKKDVNRLIAAIQQELKWDEKDIRTFDAINKGIITWSGTYTSLLFLYEDIRSSAIGYEPPIPDDTDTSSAGL